jgi:diguanylate cyclase (GGDEF)-like protein
LNRRAFEEIGREEVSGAARTGLPISLLMVDIDHFKQFNDRYGPAIGDFILRAVAEALQRCLGEDYLCRWGGDEFCVLLPGISRAEAERAVERAFAAMAELDITVEGEPVRVGVSIGVVTREDNVLEFALLMKLADVALYQAKELGRNQSAFA